MSDVACIMALGHHTRLDNVGCGMQLSPLDCKHGRATLAEECLSSPWTTYTIRRCLAWITSYPLDSTHAQSTSIMACHHIPLTLHMIGQSLFCHALITLGLHTRTDYVKHVMAWWSLECTHGQTTSSMACHQLPWTTHTVELSQA